MRSKRWRCACYAAACDGVLICEWLPYPTDEQVRKINTATALPTPDRLHLDGTHVDLELRVNALA
jgi:hypothetical protein